MKLRKRSQNSFDSVNVELKKKKVHRESIRRSERIKNDEKPIVNNDPSKTSKKDSPKNNKKKLPSKSKKKKPNDDDSDSADTESLFPKVIETGVKDILNQIADEKLENNLLLEEANVILQCRECQSFFRNIPTYLKHKQCYCPNLAGENAQTDSVGDWNPFFSKEVFELLSSSDDSDASDDDCEKDSAFEDGPSSSLKAFDDD